MAHQEAELQPPQYVEEAAEIPTESSTNHTRLTQKEEEDQACPLEQDGGHRELVAPPLEPPRQGERE